MSATQRSVRVEVPNSGSSLQTLSDASAVPASMALILAAGGDRRIWPDPVTGRNRYGTRTTPATGEIVFSSTTASNVSVDGFAAADRALKRLIGTESEPAIAYEQWFSDIRQGVHFATWTERRRSHPGCIRNGCRDRCALLDVRSFGAADHQHLRRAR